jgi:hypothetical protein
MAKTLDDVIKQLTSVAEGLSSVEAGDSYAKATYNVSVFAVSYPFEGNIDAEQIPATRGLHQIITEIHITTKTLENALPLSIPIIEEFAKAVMADPTLGGTCDTVVGPIEYKFGYLNWGGQKDNHVGPRFFTTVKIRATS